MPVTFHVVIPARYGSERLPAKPLAMIAGKPMVRHTWERAMASGAGTVTIATDDERIAAACRAFDAAVLLTAPTHRSGTDRVAEVAKRRGWDPDAIVINLQGDEPLMPPELIARAAQTLVEAEAAGIATLATSITEPAEFNNPNAVKVVCDRRSRALYFSRAPIPARRESGDESERLGLRHIGLYAYRVATLEILTRESPCPLELAERLEQLRALWLGVEIAVATVDPAPPAGVDTKDDLERMERLLNE